VWTAAVLAAIVVAVVGWFLWTRPRPMPPTEVFQGVVYSCERLPKDAEGSGQAYFVQVDLTRPGIEVYLTPLDPQAVAAGWEYRLRWTPAVCSEQRLSVVVNGTLFSSAGGRLRMPGTYAQACETVVADHQLNHVDPNSYLLWFEDDLTPHLEKGKPPPAAALRRARWGIGGQMVVLDNGKPNTWAGQEPEAQVLAAIDPKRKLLTLAVFEHASLARAARMAADHEMVDAIALDGGGSATMVLGRGARDLGGRTLLWPKRAVATHFGIRARSLDN
jgi:hypothetical protein